MPVKLSVPFLLFFCMALSVSLGCKKSTVETAVVFLGHKGNGSNNYHDDILENTLPAAVFALQSMDGVELDVQASLDGTLWIYHDASVYGASCNGGGDTEEEIPTMYDSEIEQLLICHKTKRDRIYKLQEVVDYWNSHPGGFHLSLDMKISYSAKTFAAIGGRTDYIARVALNLSKTFATIAHPNQLMVEVQTQDFIAPIRRQSNGNLFQLYYIVNGSLTENIPVAKTKGFTGISCEYTNPTVTAESIQLAHEAGLKIQLWTPYYRDQLRTAFAMGPDAIQTDNMYAKQALRVK